jgi:hypothetical protein
MDMCITLIGCEVKSLGSHVSLHITGSTQYSDLNSVIHS